MSAEDEVRATSTAFYSALNRMCNGAAAAIVIATLQAGAVVTVDDILII